MGLPVGNPSVSGDNSTPYPPAVADRWETVLSDARATATDYREDGWEALLVHTADVTPLTDDRFGLDLLAPDDEFEELQTLVDDTPISETHVYSAQDGGVRFYVIAAEASAAERAVILPAFLPLSAAPSLQARATEAGAMYTYVRPLASEARVTLTHDDPDLFF